MPAGTPAETMAHLAAAGIDFSVPAADLADWLGNPQFTPYPAMAGALLARLTGQRLKDPVFIDVITFNYEHATGVTSPRRPEDVRTDVLDGAVLEGYNERYGAEVREFAQLLVPLDGPPPVIGDVPGMTVEGATRIVDGVILVDTDNPEITTTFTLTSVHADWAHAAVPQEITRQGKGWQFTNGDMAYSVGGGEADAQALPSRAGSLNERAYAWPTTDGTFTAEAGDTCTVAGRIRVGYRPLTGRLLVSGPKGFAPNSGPQFRIALDPEVLLVPIEVVRVFSPNVPNATVSAAGQLALWDQVPIIDPAGNTKATDGGTGELTRTLRQWAHYPVTTPDPALPRGLYTVGNWFSPDSIWGRAKVRFRLVNYFELQTDDQHVNPPSVFGTGVANDAMLRQNAFAVANDPRHITDQPVVTVIYMLRIGPPDGNEAGQALLGQNVIGIPTGVPDRGATIAHEIGHLIQSSKGHSEEINNVMTALGPGTAISDAQVARARQWAQNFAGFWARP